MNYLSSIFNLYNPLSNNIHNGLPNTNFPKSNLQSQPNKEDFKAIAKNIGEARFSSFDFLKNFLNEDIEEKFKNSSYKLGGSNFCFIRNMMGDPITGQLGFLTVRKVGGEDGYELSFHCYKDKIEVMHADYNESRVFTYAIDETCWRRSDDIKMDLILLMESLIEEIQHHQQYSYTKPNGWRFESLDGIGFLKINKNIEKILIDFEQKSHHYCKLINNHAENTSVKKIQYITQNDGAHSVSYQYHLASTPKKTEINVVSGFVIETTPSMNLLYKYEKGIPLKGYIAEDLETGIRYSSAEERIFFKEGIGSFFLRNERHFPYLINKSSGSNSNIKFPNEILIEPSLDQETFQCRLIKFIKKINKKNHFCFKYDHKTIQTLMSCAMMSKKYLSEFPNKLQLKYLGKLINSIILQIDRENFIFPQFLNEYAIDDKFTLRARHVKNYVVLELISHIDNKDIGKLLPIHARLMSTKNGFFEFSFFFNIFNEVNTENGPCIRFDAETMEIEISRYKEGLLDGYHTYTRFPLSRYEGVNSFNNLTQLHLFYLQVFLYACSNLRLQEIPVNISEDVFLLVQKYKNGVLSAEKENYKKGQHSQGSYKPIGLNGGLDGKAFVTENGYLSELTFQGYMKNGQIIQTAITDETKSKYVKLHPDCNKLVYYYNRDKPVSGISLCDEDNKVLKSFPNILPEMNANTTIKAISDALKKTGMTREVSKDSVEKDDSRKNKAKDIFMDFFVGIGCEVTFNPNGINIKGSGNASEVADIRRRLMNLPRAGGKKGLTFGWTDLKGGEFMFNIQGPFETISSFLISPTTIELINKFNQEIKKKNHSNEESKLIQPINEGASKESKIPSSKLLRTLEPLTMGGVLKQEGLYITIIYKKAMDMFPIYFKEYKGKEIFKMNISEDELKNKIISRIRKSSHLKYEKQESACDEIRFIFKGIDFNLEYPNKTYVEIQEDLLKDHVIKKIETKTPLIKENSITSANEDSTPTKEVQNPDFLGWLENMNLKINLSKNSKVHKTIYSLPLTTANATSVYHQAIKLPDFFNILADQVNEVIPDCLHVYTSNGNLTVVVNHNLFHQVAALDKYRFFEEKLKPKLISLLESKQEPIEVYEYRKENLASPRILDSETTIESNYPLLVITSHNYITSHLNRLKEIADDLKKEKTVFDSIIVRAVCLHVTCFIHLLKEHIKDAGIKGAEITLLLGDLNQLRNSLRHKNISQQKLIDILEFVLIFDYSNLLSKNNITKFTSKVIELLVPFQDYDLTEKELYDQIVLEKIQFKEYLGLYAQSSLTPLFKDASLMTAATIGKLLRLLKERNLPYNHTTLDYLCLKVRAKIGHPETSYEIWSDDIMKMLFSN